VSITLHHKNRAPFCWTGSTGPIGKCPLLVLQEQLAHVTDAVDREKIQTQIDSTILSCDEQYQHTIISPLEKKEPEAIMNEETSSISSRRRGRL